LRSGLGQRLDQGIAEVLSTDAELSFLGPAVEDPDPSPWRTTHMVRLALLDLVSIFVALNAAAWSRVGGEALALQVGEPVVYGLLIPVITVGWFVALSSQDAYESRFYGTGAEEYKRVIRGTVMLFSFIAIVSYSFKLELARSFVAVTLPIGLALLLMGRYGARQWLIRRRAQGRALHRVVGVGDVVSVAHLRDQLHSEPHAGYAVVARCAVDGDVVRAARAARADTVAVTASHDMTPQRLRELSWSLEGTRVSLIVAPSLTDVAGPRITVNPVGGLPLLHVDVPEFTWRRRVVKHLTERVIAVVALLVLAPLLITIGMAVRLTSPGPALFRQKRVGGDGGEFRVFKFRTMFRDAESRLAALRAQNESDGHLFKIKDDPRVTPIGAFLRRASLDELPQLLNVALGDMSLVGPRPLPVDQADFVGPERRRLLVRPGITGLWQVSGRSDLSWEDAVRLDLYYVENWSITLDLLILARTIRAVIRGSGAY
jgi:exopolysaccharide biosynthesis polyprenyl glycosylphosphotransferase